MQGNLPDLPEIFTYSQARALGLSDRRLYELRDQGTISAVSRGLYRRMMSDAHYDLNLVEIAHRRPVATLCLTSALARHGLTDDNPGTIDLAIPRGTHRATLSAPVTWHSFDPATYDIDRSELRLTDGESIGIYGPRRCILDAIRLRHREGPELGYTALRRWLARKGSSSTELLSMAQSFPKAEKALRTALEIML